jgi:hypothetical protein
MHKCVLYRQTRRKYSMFSNMERDFLCVCTPETFVSAKASKFSGFSAAAPVGLRFAVPKWCSPLIRGIKYLRLPNWSIIPNIMFERLSRTLTTVDLRHWTPDRGRADRMNSPRMTRHLSLKRPSVRRIFWAVRLSDGRWKNCGTIFWPKRSSRRSALRRFGVFCMRKRSSFDARRHGKSATTRDWRLKKTDSPVCKSARSEWSHHFLRRVWASGNPAAAGTGLVPNRPSETTAGHVYPPLWGTALASLLRCPQEEAMGLHAAPQAASGVSGSLEAFAEKVSPRAANSPDSGQLLAAPQRESAAVLPHKQYSFDLDADQCIMAQSYRMSVHPCQRICDSWNLLSKPSGTQNFLG